jgi:hypothetical protein
MSAWIGERCAALIQSREIPEASAARTTCGSFGSRKT